MACFFGSLLVRLCFDIMLYLVGCEEHGRWRVIALALWFQLVADIGRCLRNIGFPLMGPMR